MDLPLPPLDQDSVLALVRELFVPSAPRLRLSRVLWERSRGNPGFLTELIRGLERKGSISRALPGAPYELHVSPDAIPLPDSLPNAIIESYRELAPYDRRWLQRLSVCGGRIRQAFLRHTWPEASGPDLPEVLSRLVNAGWLIPAGHRLRFRRPALPSGAHGASDAHDVLQQKAKIRNIRPSAEPTTIRSRMPIASEPGAGGGDIAGCAARGARPRGSPRL